VNSVIMGRLAEQPATPTCVAASSGGGCLLLRLCLGQHLSAARFEERRKPQQRYTRTPTCAAVHSGSATARRSTGSAVFQPARRLYALDTWKVCVMME